MLVHISPGLLGLQLRRSGRRSSNVHERTMPMQQESLIPSLGLLFAWKITATDPSVHGVAKDGNNGSPSYIPNRKPDMHWST